jgi:hypothetical protein
VISPDVPVDQRFTYAELVNSPAPAVARFEMASGLTG